MADVKVKEFADMLRVPIDLLLTQLDAAGIRVAGPEDTISDIAKMELLTFLRRTHGRTQDEPAPRKVQLPRKRSSDLIVKLGERIRERSEQLTKPQQHEEGTAHPHGQVIERRPTSERSILYTSTRTFVSYSRDDDDHINWVKQFARRLRANGVEAILDEWELHPGDIITHFMEQSVATSDFVIMICTPRYKTRADSRQGGVGYEGSIITAELYSHANSRKYIPVLRGPDWLTCAPRYLEPRMYIDIRPGDSEDRGFRDVLITILGRREKPPPLGKPPQEP